MYSFFSIKEKLITATNINNFIKFKNSILAHNNLKIANKKKKHKKKNNKLIETK